MNTTDTPRTDAATELYGERPFMTPAVPVEFAKDLERELNASNAKVENLKTIKQIKVSKRPYRYQCGDGCCLEFGESWSVDGVKVAHGPCDDNLLKQLLKHIGYDARIVNENEDGEEVCEL